MIIPGRWKGNWYFAVNIRKKGNFFIHLQISPQQEKISNVLLKKLLN